jgi:hypothetical protein
VGYKSAKSGPSTPKSSTPVQAVDYNILITLLPNAPTGWIADEPTGGTMTAQDGSWSTATIAYTKAADENVNAMVIIEDSAHYLVGGWEVWSSFSSVETSEGYFRSSKVAGYPAWETFSKPDSYVKWVGIDERFMVYVSINGGTKSDLDLFVNLINYDGIARLQ